MGKTYRHTGKHIHIDTASGAIASGAFVYQEGFFGLAIGSATTGEPLEIDISGVHYIAVPASTVKGDRLYADLSAGESVSLTLVRNAPSGNTLVGMAEIDRDSAGFARVLLAPQPQPAE